MAPINAGPSNAVTSLPVLVLYNPDTQLLTAGRTIVQTGTSPIGLTAIATGVLPLSSLGAITPVNATVAVTLTLPDAATAFATTPYGLVVLSQKGVGAPTFAPAGSDSLRATLGIVASVQYGMIAAQIISATEWALA